MRSRKVDGLKIQEVRELAGLSQEDLARKIKVDRSTIAHWESKNPVRQPSSANFRALCRALKADPTSLLVVSDDQAA